MTLNQIMPPDMPERDRALAWEITMGAVKFKKKLEFIAQSYIKAPLRQQEHATRAALILGFYQLTELTSVPDFAAVNETVSAVKEVISEKSSGFVNAVLRAYLMQPAKAKFPDKESEPVKYLSLFYSYPEWLVRRWLDRLGAVESESLLAAGNARPGTSFKILLSGKGIDEAKSSLSGAGLRIDAGRYFPDYFGSHDSPGILNHNLFKNGQIIVQDESQGVPIYLLDPEPGSSVLDICAAPGGKSIALADRVGESGRVISVDINAQRLRDFKENIERTGFTNIDIKEADILEFEPGGRFGHILVDVPCSSLGTIASNADLRWTKSEKDIMILSDMQKEILNRAAVFAADGAVIVYSTCTTEPEEIEEVVHDFLEYNPEFHLEDGNSPLIEPFKTDTGIYRTWPHKHGIGGGGFARLKKSGKS